VLLVSFAALPVRGLIAAFFIRYWGVFPVQLLDGVGAGLQSVAVPALVARILYGTGRVNVGQGAVMTVQGVGASLSPAIGGWLAQWQGYGPAFLMLGAFALGSLLIWTSFASIVKQACSGNSLPDAASPQVVRHHGFHPPPSA
jgi:MFS family permease